MRHPGVSRPPLPVETRVLVIDDTPAIGDALRSVRPPHPGSAPERGAFEQELFGCTASADLIVEVAGRGDVGVERIRQARLRGHRFAIAFVDLGAPDWAGLRTTDELWKTDPDLQVVLVTGEVEVPWDAIRRLERLRDNLLVLKRPFEPEEVERLARVLARKWELNAVVSERIQELERRLVARNVELEALAEKLQREASERARIEVELRLAQKLEAVGQLAAGVAHELNTPIQYVSDSLHFLESAGRDLRALVEAYRRERPVLETAPGGAEALARLSEAEDVADLEYLDDALPKATRRVADGVAQVAKLVRAMKEFAHPGQRELARTDLRRCIENTVTVARNEYKYVADVLLELDEIPLVLCDAGELNQVFLNLIVNAAHAIADRGEPDVRGTITIRCASEGSNVHISITDTGCGIPEAIRQRIFEPFFTTKQVGRGTGQGLAIARAIVEQHGGSITFETAVGRGTCFSVRLPVDGPRPEQP